MKLVSLEEQNYLLAVLKQNKKNLLQYKGVHHVDVGYAYRKGRPTKKLAVRVHVYEKKPESKLLASQVLPKEINGTLVDVIQSNPELQLINRRVVQDPLLGGVEIGVQIRNTSLLNQGTMGGIVFDRDSLDPMGITNFHVIVPPQGRAGDPVNQPGSFSPGDQVGSIVRGNSLDDCAVFKLDGLTGRKFSLDIADISTPTTVTATGVARIGARVLKSGRTTAITFGIIDGVDSVFKFTIVPDPNRPPSSGKISAAGDSGSLWLDAQSHVAIGLHFAGETSPNPQRAWAKYIGGVLEVLNVFFFNEVAMATAYIGFRCKVLARTRPNASCRLRVIYPSGRISTAKGLGRATADKDGWVSWSWRIGTSTHPHVLTPGMAKVTLDGQLHEIKFLLKLKQVITP